MLCAGYESTTPGEGVCIELSATGVVKAEDGGDGGKAGARVALEVRYVSTVYTVYRYTFFKQRAQSNHRKRFSFEDCNVKTDIASGDLERPS